MTSDSLKIESDDAINRRRLLAAAPAALVAGALPAVASEDETPVMRLFQKWRNARTEEDSAFTQSATGDDAECDAACKRRSEIEERLMSEPCQCSGDWMMKMIAYTDFGQFATDDHTTPELWAEARALVA